MTDELEKVAEDSARGSFFLISGAATATVIMAIEAILFARLLGAELYGQYTYAFIIPQFLFLLTDLGVNQGVTKFTVNLNASGETGRIVRIIKYAMLLKALAGLILFITSYSLAGWFASTVLGKPALTHYISLFSISILFQIVFTTATYAFVGLDKAEYNAAITNVQALAKTIISVVLILMGFSVAGAIIGYAASYIAGSVTGAILLLLALRTRQGVTGEHSVREDLGKLVRYGMPLYVSVVLTGLVPLYQYFVFARFSTDVDAGNYKGATNFATLMTVLSIPITTALLAAFSKLDSSTKQKIATFFKLAHKYTVAIVLPVTVLMITFSNEIVQTVLPGYQSAPVFLATYCLVYFLVGLGSLTLASLFNGLGETKNTMIMSSITFLTLFVLSPLLTMAYGVQGPIPAFLIASAAGTVYASIAARKKFGIEFGLRSLLKIYLISGVSAILPLVLFRFVHLSQVVRLSAGAFLYLFAYATLLPVAKVINVYELDMIKRVTQRTRLLSLIVNPVLRYERVVFEMNKETFAVIIKLAVVILSALAFFFQDLILIFSDAIQNEATSYLLAVPLLLLYLVYRKRKMIRAAISLEPSRLWNRIPINEVAGGLLFLISLLFYSYGSYTFTPLEYHLIALPFFVSACMLILFNVQILRQMIFPIAFLFLLVPPPAEILYQIGSVLSTFSAELAYRFLALLRFPVTLAMDSGMPTIYVAQPSGAVIPLYVDVACSGIYSQIGFFIFALFMAYTVRDKPWKKTAMFVLGFPLIYIINVMRIGVIGIIGYYYGMNLAMDMFHLLGGWVLIFFGTFLLLGISDKLLKVRITARQLSQCPECRPGLPNKNDFCHTCGRIQKINLNRIHPKDVTKIALIVVGVMLILSFQAPVFALTRVPAIMVKTPSGQELSAGILPEIPGYNLSYWIHNTEFEQQAKQDMSLEYYFYPLNQSQEWLVVGVEIASTRSSLHRWEACLITWPIAHGNQSWVRQLDLRDVTLVENPPVIGRYFAYQRYSDNGTVVVLYWYESVTFAMNSTSQQEYVKISLVVEPANPQAVSTVEDQLLVIGKIVAGHWQPVKTWSQIALLLSLQGDKLIGVASVSLVGIFVLYVLQERKTRGQNMIAYQKLSKAARLTIDSVSETEQKTIPTLQNISMTYEKMNSKALSEEQLLTELEGPEKVGLIRTGIASRHDEPVRIWRTNCSFQQILGKP